MKTSLIILAALVVSQPATAARNVIYGVNDPNFTDSNVAMLRTTNAEQVAVTANFDCTFKSTPTVNTTLPALVVFTGSASCFPLTDYYRQEYAYQVQKIAEKYPNIKEIQIWNEPEYFYDADQYVPLLAASYYAIKSVNSKIKVLAVGAHPDATCAPYPNWMKMTAASFAKEVASYKTPMMDGYSYHPYWKWRSTNCLTKMFKKVLKHVPSYWWTETGMWSDGPQWGSPHMVGTPQEAAQRVKDVATKAYCDPHVVADFNYLLEDEPLNSRQYHWRSGFYYADGKAKPSLYSFSSTVRSVKLNTTRCGRLRAIKVKHGT